jgi:hypothetical protein
MLGSLLVGFAGSVAPLVGFGSQGRSPPLLPVFEPFAVVVQPRRVATVKAEFVFANRAGVAEGYLVGGANFHMGQRLTCALSNAKSTRDFASVSDDALPPLLVTHLRDLEYGLLELALLVPVMVTPR